MSSEGRLSSAELDDLLDPDRGRLGPARLEGSHGPSEPGPPTQTETLERGEERATWTARAAGRVRHHPRLTAAAVALALAAGIGWQGYQRTRPPPLDTRMATAAWFVPSPPDLQGMSIQGDLAVSRLHVQLPDGVPPVTVVSLAVPGLGRSTVTQDGSDLTVTNPLDCNGIGDLSEPLALPVLQLTRTDAWGRSVSGTVQLSDSPGTAAIPASVVADTLRQACFAKIADSLTLLGAVSHAGVAGGPSALVLSIKNPTRRPVLLLGAQAAFEPDDASIGTSNSAPDPASEPPTGTLVPAFATVTATMPVRRTDCGVAVSQRVTTVVPVDDGRRSGDFTLWVAPPRQVPNDSFDNWTSLVLTPAQRSTVAAALTAPCIGAPTLSYTASPQVVVTNANNRRVSFHLRLRASEGTTNLDLSNDPFYWSTGSLWSSV
ncbi:MAG: hypothetical protein ABI468_02805, partial [Candidatus Nanopelagicales bacterium]